MRRIAPLAAGLLLLGLGCYTDDVIGPPGGGKPLSPVVRVHITDDPFPFDSVQSVNLYIDSIAATTTFDTSGGSNSWVTLATPHQAVNLLDYQNGALAFLGQDSAIPGLYKSVSVTIDVDSSSIILSGGAHASIHWPTSGRLTLYAYVSPALTIGDSISDLVIDVDVGHSFYYNLFGGHEFTFIPVLRAVNGAQTGAIQGTVTTSYYGGSQPVANADVTVFPGGFATSAPLATGRTDAAGHYKVAYLPAGPAAGPWTYAISVTQPLQPGLATVTLNNLTVTAGGTLTQDISLPAASAGTSGIHISGNTTVGVGGAVELFAAVTDSLGNPVANPTVVWTSSDTAIAQSLGLGAIDSVVGVAAGT
ncbi:MAG TPA: DUF4382 domain-containing protein, partial [Gemmatimonadales bacterium]|nr:DUF4382 domain-containing protein [Gemmatimonadales bacterium]